MFRWVLDKSLDSSCVDELSRSFLVSRFRCLGSGDTITKIVRVTSRLSGVTVVGFGTLGRYIMDDMHSQDEDREPTRMKAERCLTGSALCRVDWVGGFGGYATEFEVTHWVVSYLRSSSFVGAYPVYSLFRKSC